MYSSGYSSQGVRVSLSYDIFCGPGHPDDVAMVIVDWV